MTPEQRPSAANTQEGVVPHSGKAGYEYPLDRHDDGVELDKVADDLAPADTRNLDLTTSELELIRLHRVGRLQAPVEAEIEAAPTPEPITLPDVQALTAGSRGGKADRAEKSSNPGRKRLLIGGGSLALIAAGVATVVGIAKGPNEEHRTEPIVSPVATAPASIEASPAPTAGAIETAPAGSELIVEQKTTVEAMEAMQLEDFAKLPYADRYAYALSKNPGLATGGIADKEKVRQQPLYITSSFWQAINKSALEVSDPQDGAKVMAAGEYYTTDIDTGEISAEYKSDAEDVIKAGGRVGISSEIILEGTGKWQSGVDRSGTPIDFVNITYSYDRRDGSKIANSLGTSQAIEVTVKTLDGHVANAYPRGYGIQGKASPVNDYPY